ncbi:MAG: hypothetical protein ACRD4J_02065 [Nitrososphaeraceae archaeon]
MVAALQVIRLNHTIGDVTAGHHCEHPNHDEHIEAFLRKYHTAKGRMPDAIITVDPEHWYISDDQKKHCQVLPALQHIRRHKESK